MRGNSAAHPSRGKLSVKWRNKTPLEDLIYLVQVGATDAFVIVEAVTRIPYISRCIRVFPTNAHIYTRRTPSGGTP